MSGRAVLTTCIVLASVSSPGRGVGQEADETAEQQQATVESEEEAEEETEAEEAPTIVMGTLVGDDGEPVVGQGVELFMVVEGSARDAFGNPLKGAYSVGAGRQALGMSFGRETDETDSDGRFSLELPEFMFVPSGTKLRGFTVGAREGDALKTLSIDGEMATIVPSPEAKEVELGDLKLAPAAGAN